MRQLANGSHGGALLESCGLLGCSLLGGATALGVLVVAFHDVAQPPWMLVDPPLAAFLAGFCLTFAAGLGLEFWAWRYGRRRGGRRRWRRASPRAPRPRAGDSRTGS